MKHPNAVAKWANDKDYMWCDRCGSALDWNPGEHNLPDEIAEWKNNSVAWYECTPCHERNPALTLGSLLQDNSGHSYELVEGEPIVERCN